MQPDTVRPKILCLGLEPMVLDTVKTACPNAELALVESSDDFMAKFENWMDSQFSLILAGSAIADLAPAEMAQTVNSQCPSTTKYFVSGQDCVENKILKKNGFTQVFTLPLDAVFFRKLLLNTVKEGTERVLRAVRVFDIQGEDELGFDAYAYLPMNKRYIKITGEGKKISNDKMTKISKRQITAVHIDVKDLDKFNAYTAKKMLNQGGSATEREEKLREYVRGFFTDLFDSSVEADFDNGRELVKNVQGVISNYITKGSGGDWYKRLLSAIGESDDSYSHASNVSTFAAMFALATGHPHPEDLAMAGMFHDLGLAKVPVELQNKKFEEMTEEEKKVYQAHPEQSCNLVKGKRLIMTENVEKAIMQHHEQWSGRGFPKNLQTDRIFPDAQILSLADQFDELTHIEEGKKRLTPGEALDEIKRNGSIDPQLIAKIRQLMAATEQATPTAASPTKAA